MSQAKTNPNLAVRMSNVLGTHVDRVDLTQSGIVVHLPLGVVPPSRLYELFPEARHHTPTVRDQSLGAVKQNVIDISWDSIEKIEGMPRAGASTLFAISTLALLYFIYQFWLIF